MPYPAYQWSILGITTISTINELSTKLFMIGINIASKINGELKYKMKKIYAHKHTYTYQNIDQVIIIPIIHILM